MDNEIRKYCESCKFYSVLGCQSTLICRDGNRFIAADVQPVKRELVKIVDSDFMTQGYLTIEKFYSCPRCGETFGNVRFSRRSQLAEMYKFCYKCGQGLDWAETTKG